MNILDGDYLGRIASNYNISVSDIKKWNKLNTSKIKIGDKLSLFLNPEKFSKAESLLDDTEAGLKLAHYYQLYR